MSLVRDDDDHANDSRKINPGMVRDTQNTPRLFSQSCHPGELAPIRACSLGSLNLEASCRQEPIFNFTPEDECKYTGVRVGMCSHRVLEFREVGDGKVGAPLLSEVKRGDGILRGLCHR